MKIRKLMTIALIMFGALFTSCSKDDTVKVSSVKLSESTITLKTGEKAELKATVTPSNATNAIVTWSTSAAKVATVDDKGNVTAIAAGTATITAKAGDMTATCAVTVKERDVYVVGYANIGGKNVATIWKNGVESLVYSTSSTSLYVTSLYVSDGNVYITAYDSAGIGTKSYLFKNGVKTASKL